MSARDRLRSVQGFTLLEAVFALTLFALLAAALYGWQASNLQAMQRIQASDARAQATLSAIAMLDNLNPMSVPQGEMTHGDLRVVWNARLVEPVQDVATWAGRAGLYVVGLYELSVDVERDEQAVAAFTLRRIGYRQVRNPQADGDPDP